MIFLTVSAEVLVVAVRTAYREVLETVRCYHKNHRKRGANNADQSDPYQTRPQSLNEFSTIPLFEKLGVKLAILPTENKLQNCKLYMPPGRFGEDVPIP